MDISVIFDCLRISKLTGCKNEDVSCHDRHALQMLIRGPFRSKFTAEEESKLVGVPPNLRHAIMTLPHSYAPRLDASVHLRSQFRHFEYLVGRLQILLVKSYSLHLLITYTGPEDTALWPAAQKEQDDWLNSKDSNAGVGLYKAVEGKIMSELENIKRVRQATVQRRRQLVSRYLLLLSDGYDRRRLDTSSAGNGSAQSQRNVSQIEFENEHILYTGDPTEADNRVYIYVASDNERVKEGFTQHLLGHPHIAVMRVRSDHHIVHAKNLGYLKRNTTGVMNLVLDWYCMSLSNLIFAWRRDTDLISTFAQVSVCEYQYLYFHDNRYTKQSLTLRSFRLERTESVR